MILYTIIYAKLVNLRKLKVPQVLYIDRPIKLFRRYQCCTHRGVYVQIIVNLKFPLTKVEYKLARLYHELDRKKA